MNKIRVRFAPSPTGHLHIGGLRTALFNWLFAKHNDGKFLIRVEDTDLERSKPEYLESILNSLGWASLHSDEPIVIQSTRIEEHKRVAKKLLDEGKAYRCICTQEELTKRLGASAAQEGYVKYDGLCRNKNYPENVDKPFVVRFKLPEKSITISFDDLIRGSVSFDTDQFDDFIILRSDGMPMYNFVVIVDDAFMKISHVIRGEEHLSNTPKQILLYQACGYEIPEFAHLPLILGKDGKKLSKRDAAVAVLDYKNEGYLASALCNYLVRLGWAYKDQEIFTTDEMIKNFLLKDVSKKGAFFDIAKLQWLNSVYLKKLSAKEIIEIIERDLDKNFIQYFAKWNLEQVHGFVDLYKQRVKTLKELIQELKDIYNIQIYDVKNLEFSIDLNLKKVLLDFIKELEKKEKIDSEFVKQFCGKENIELSYLAKPIRFALTGKIHAPAIADLYNLIGKSESINRINNLINKI
ncbi:glutamate--tRNA ligase [Candidatus Dependentiae bacterium]|nr:glutamate--tRNA ligase [Candidatus Dependentiae bacterium]